MLSKTNTAQRVSSFTLPLFAAMGRACVRTASVYGERMSSGRDTRGPRRRWVVGTTIKHRPLFRPKTPFGKHKCINPLVQLCPLFCTPKQYPFPIMWGDAPYYGKAKDYRFLVQINPNNYGVSPKKTVNKIFRSKFVRNCPKKHSAIEVGKLTGWEFNF